jgi:hypothetical protein
MGASRTRTGDLLAEIPRARPGAHRIGVRLLSGTKRVREPGHGRARASHWNRALPCGVRLDRQQKMPMCRSCSRRVQLGGCTTSPDGSWVTQQARNLGLFLAEQQIRFLIRDRDSKYTGPFDEIFRANPDFAHASPRTEGQRRRRALRPHRPLRVPRLAAHPQQPTPRAIPPHLCPALQHPAPTPRTRPVPT